MSSWRSSWHFLGILLTVGLPLNPESFAFAYGIDNPSLHNILIESQAPPSGLPIFAGTAGRGGRASWVLPTEQLCQGNTIVIDTRGQRTAAQMPSLFCHFTLPIRWSRSHPHWVTCSLYLEQQNRSCDCDCISLKVICSLPSPLQERFLTLSSRMDTVQGCVTIWDI